MLFPADVSFNDLRLSLILFFVRSNSYISSFIVIRLHISNFSGINIHFDFVSIKIKRYSQSRKHTL